MLQETAVCVIGVALLLFNLSKSLRAALALFCLLFLLIAFPRLRSRPYHIKSAEGTGDYTERDYQALEQYIINLTISKSRLFVQIAEHELDHVYRKGLFILSPAVHELAP